MPHLYSAAIVNYGLTEELKLMIRIRDITLPFDHKPDALAAGVVKRLDIPEQELLDFTIIRKSIDARRKNNIVAVYTIDVRVENEPEVLSRFSQDIRISPAPGMSYRMPAVGDMHGLRPVVVGSGPCGLFAALILAQLGYKPLLIERGKEIKSRIKDVRNFWRNGKLDPESSAKEAPALFPMENSPRR